MPRSAITHPGFRKRAPAIIPERGLSAGLLHTAAEHAKGLPCLHDAGTCAVG